MKRFGQDGKRRKAFWRLRDYLETRAEVYPNALVLVNAKCIDDLDDEVVDDGWFELCRLNTELYDHANRSRDPRWVTLMNEVEVLKERVVA